jgi:hypothetical protein
MVYDKALREFVFDLEENKEYTYIVRDNVKGRSKINYKYKQPRERNTIISITERRQVNEHKR